MRTQTPKNYREHWGPWGDLFLTQPCCLAVTGLRFQRFR